VWTCLTCGLAQKANHLLHTRTNMSEEAGLLLIKTRKSTEAYFRIP